MMEKNVKENFIDGKFREPGAIITTLLYGSIGLVLFHAKYFKFGT